MNASYFNTTNLMGAALQWEIANAEHQEAAILAIFKAHDEPLSPSDVWRICEAAGKRWPLTSVRRAITSLTDAKQLSRAPGMKSGVYGKPEHLWTHGEAA